MTKTVEIKNPLGDLNITEAIKEETVEQQGEKATASSAQARTKKKENGKKSLPKDVTDKIIEGCLIFDNSSDKGKAVRIPSILLDKLQEYSDKYDRRLSVRTMVAALVQTFVYDYDGEEVIDKFMEIIHYVKLTPEELEKRRKAAEKAKEKRMSSKS